ncbi:MAG: hypothetical protein ACXVAY_09635 [Mucilaginibacter sp.]
MTLSITDIAYINTRLDEYELKYQEIYDEIKDHVILAMESARANGDERDIAHVYDDMMATQFPGYYAFEKIAGAYEKVYRTKIRKMVWANFRHSLNPLNLAVIVLSLILGYPLGQTKSYYDVLIALLLIVSVLPIGYVHYKTRVIKTDDGKRSIVKDYVRKQARVLILNYNMVNAIVYFSNKGYLSFIPLSAYYPTVQILIILLSVIYGFSVIKICNQEIKLPMSAANKQ